MGECRYKGVSFKYEDFYGESWEYKVSGVYKITNIINGKVYIGESVNVRVRWLNHVQRARRHLLKYNKIGTEIGKAFKEYGVDNFTFEILDVEEDHRKRKEKEIYYIKENESTEERKGYNVREGHIGTVKDESSINVESIKEYLKHSRITSKEIAEIHKVNKITVWRINNGDSYKEDEDYPLRKDIITKQIARGIENITDKCGFCGKEGNILRENKVYCTEKCFKEFKYHEKERYKKIKRYERKLKKDKKEKEVGKCEKCDKKTANYNLKKHGKLCSDCLVVINLANGYIEYKGNNKVYKEELEEQLYKMTFTKVAKIYGVSDNAVRKWCKRFGMPTDAKTYNTDIKREEFSIKMREIGKDKEGRRVGKFDIEGNYIEEYRSIAEAVRKHNGNSGIEKVLYGDRVTASGYKWKFLD